MQGTFTPRSRTASRVLALKWTQVDFAGRCARRPLVSDADADAQARAEDARVEPLRTLRNEFGWETDAVLERARRMVKQQPGLVKLLEESGTANSTRVWMAICRKARVLMNRDK